MIVVLCQSCGAEVQTYPSPTNKKKYCSKDCFYKRSGENIYNWKGEDAGYRALHNWVRRRLGKPTTCSICNNSRNARRLEWSNVSGEYRRDLMDWIQLCSKCHHEIDNRYRATKGNRIYERLS